jgi:adenylate cyclase
MKNFIFVIIVFLASEFNQLLANDFQATTDSLLAILERNPDRPEFDSLIDHFNQNMFNDPDLACMQIKRALPLVANFGDHQYTARMFLLAGISYDLRGLYDSAFLMYDKGLEIAEKHGYSGLMGELYNNYSITLSVLGRLEESITYTLKAKDIFETSGDSAQLARIYNNLGSRYAEIRFIDLALDYYLKAAAINESREDLRRLAYNYGNIGLLLQGEKQNDKALEYFYMSLNLLDTVQNRYDYSIAMHNLALAHLGIEDYETALKYETRALSLAHEVNDELGIISALNGMAKIYNGMGQPRKALEFYDQSEPIARRLGARSYLMNIYEDKAKIYADLNDFRKAFEFNNKFLAIKDSVMTIERDKAVEMLKEFESERKQQEIQLLTKDAEIQKLSIRRQKIIRNSVAVVGFLLLLIALGLFSRYRYVRKTRNELAEKNKIINYEKSRSDDLLLNILPAETAEELKNTGTSEARHFEMVTVMFTDFTDFTKMAEVLSAKELVSEIDYCFKAFDQIIAKYNVEKIKTIGDSYMCAGGLPVPNTTNPVDVVMAAIEIQKFIENLKEEKKAQGKPYFELRIGVHTGPVIAGIVGIKKFQYDIWGDTVNIASRMESSGQVGKINISQMTYEKINGRFKCVHRGKIEAKNKGAIDMYFVEGIESDTKEANEPSILVRSKT